MSEDKKDKAEAAPAKSKTMLIVIIAAVGGIAITGAIMFFVVGKPAAEGPAKPAATAALTNEFGPVVDMADFVVNIQSEEGTAYLKVKLSLELVAETATDTVNKAMPLKEAMDRSAELLEDGAERAFRMIQIGMRLK